MSKTFKAHSEDLQLENDKLRAYLAEDLKKSEQDSD